MSEESNAEDCQQLPETGEKRGMASPSSPQKLRTLMTPLELPASRTVRNRFLLFQPPSCGSPLQQPEEAQQPLPRISVSSPEPCNLTVVAPTCPCKIASSLWTSHLPQGWVLLPTWPACNLYLDGRWWKSAGAGVFQKHSKLLRNFSVLSGKKTASNLLGIKPWEHGLTSRLCKWYVQTLWGGLLTQVLVH